MAKPDVVKRLGARIRDLRSRADLTQEGLAERAGITWHFVSAIECGTKGATVETLAALAGALGISLSELLWMWTARCRGTWSACRPRWPRSRLRRSAGCCASLKRRWRWAATRRHRHVPWPVGVGRSRRPGLSEADQAQRIPGRTRARSAKKSADKPSRSPQDPPRSPHEVQETWDSLSERILDVDRAMILNAVVSTRSLAG